MSKRPHFSSGVTLVCGTSFGLCQPLQPTQKHVKLNKTSKQLANEKSQYQAQLAIFKNRKIFSMPLRMMWISAMEDFLHASENDVDLGNGAWVDEDEIAFSRPPPGDKGFFSSHAGGEVHLQDLFLDTLAEHLLIRKQKDHQTQKDRVECQVQAWKSMLPDLVSTFLKFQSQGPPARNKDNGSQALWTIEVISVEVSASVTLVECGIIPTSLEQPQLGISIETLHFYRQLRWVCPCFSINAFAKALNFYHAVPHTPYLADQLSNAYDSVDKLVGSELGHDDSWEAQNVCPPCLYKIEDETPMKFRFLAAMDGNNSLKLFVPTLGHQHLDAGSLLKKWTYSRKSNQDPESETMPSGVPLDFDGLEDANCEEVAWLNILEHNELAQCLNACVDRWKNAGPEA
ncbi:hypothetical protein CVT25_008390 [Psilocybe cyanescens]|uniref:CxC1-like cysteine cluster associated with KDZ transposases domain-containing protein n=1 Tax=Psilocybe cyanescens TaxID=93625 RepID=A0A409XVL0_PSICY|nr:hypothetical protein CVT25_008390 [Psilocybe cyanescens]